MHLGTRCAVVTGAVGALLDSVLMPATAEAASAVRMRAAYYDSPGSDTGSNKSLNAEYIVTKNYGSRAKRLTGWTQRDLDGHVYKFPKFKLRPGRSVKVHTGSGSDTRRHLYWDAEGYVWNNDGERATLKKRNGDRADRCSWDGGSRYENR